VERSIRIEDAMTAGSSGDNPDPSRYEIIIIDLSDGEPGADVEIVLEGHTCWEKHKHDDDDEEGEGGTT